MIRIGICEDIPDMAELIKSVIDAEDDMQTVFTAFSKDELCKKIGKYPLDILLMDIQLEHSKAGIEATKIISETYPNIKIIILTVFEDSELIIESYYMGAVDYIIKTPAMENLVSHIRTVFSQHDFLGPLIVKNLKLERTKQYNMHESLLFFINNWINLTPMERDILKQIYDGKNRAKIAKDNFIDVSTVHTHMKHILKKLGQNSTKELIRFLHSINFYDYISNDTYSG